jgi:predicted restriction endonuclease
MNYGCSQWLGKLANLNAARTAERSIAPHKPLMLLTVIDLISIPPPPRIGKNVK